MIIKQYKQATQRLHDYIYLFQFMLIKNSKGYPQIKRIKDGLEVWNSLYK